MFTLYLISNIWLYLPAIAGPVDSVPHAASLRKSREASNANQLYLSTDTAGSVAIQNHDIQDSVCHDGQDTTCSQGLTRLPGALSKLLDAIDVMQSEYFELWAGTWPSSIDWTAAVLGTHVSATLTTIVSTIDYASSSCKQILVWENTINSYFGQLTTFYFGENSFSLRNQAYDDMLWVVLGWLENVKFSNLYTQSYWPATKGRLASPWHGTQLKGPAAHRARTFYDLASHGWDNDLCDGGMNWNPTMEPYKNAITNELFISASIAMYLYFPGDDNDSPFLSTTDKAKYPPHEKRYLDSAVKAYQWLKDSNMTNSEGLFMDGFHIEGWKRYRNGTIDRGTGKCNKLNRMVFTYNQGVVLSGLRGLWIATNDLSYLQDGHALVHSVISATGWPYRHSKQWSGLGRGGVLEEFCDSSGDCSQNGHTFKGIFFHHLTEFCRPLWSQEEEFMESDYGSGLDYLAYGYHKHRCLSYYAWIKHNAQAAIKTRNEKGIFGTWWGITYDPLGIINDAAGITPQSIPPGAIDYRNAGIPKKTGRESWQRSNQDIDIIEDPFGDLSSQSTSSKIKQVAEQLSDSFHTSSNCEDVNDRGRGRTVETQSGGVAVLRALWQWQALVSQSGRQGQSISPSDEIFNDEL
ncbi:putative glycosyl hydrolase [Phaeomoniella chlamydospora]|uniref:Putative glycosyl hydrolase n=1 Tax=Phaeomoniella chlamydospora TaxID=158046 RepID=A0A0G2F2R0_PHACM|nr:putative glycosyl hydrolase [Phaeomoniella chlamydospora]